MANSMTAFAPMPTQTISLAAGVASSNVAFTPQAAAAISAGAAPQCEVYNAGTVVAFVNTGNTSATVATAPNGAIPGDIPVAPGAVVIFSFATLEDASIASTPAVYLAAVTASGTATLYCSPGTGL